MRLSDRRTPRRRARPLSRTVAVAGALALAAIALMGALSVFLLLRGATRHLDSFLVAALQKALHREVRIGRLDVLTPGRIRVQDVAVSAGPTFRSGDLLRVREARVQYRLADLIRGRIDPLGSISSAEIDDPYLLITRDRNNRFNLQDLFPKRRKPPTPSTFRGTVRLHRGTVQFVDAAVRDLPAPQTNVLSGIEAALDAGLPPLMSLQLSAPGDGRRVSAVSGAGTIQPDRGAFTFRIRAGSSEAPYWVRYFSRFSQLNVRSGSGVATIDVYKPRAKTYTSATIRADITDASATTPYLKAPLTGARGSVVLRTGHPLEIGLNLTGSAGTLPVRVFGEVFTGPDGRVALRADASGVTLAALDRVVGGVPRITWLTPLAPASASALVYGPLGHLTTLASVNVPAAKLYTSDLSDVRAQVRYENRVVYLPSVTARAGGAAVTGSGRIDLRDKAVRFIADVPGVSVRSLGLARLPLTGSVSSHLAVTGSTQAPRVGALVVARNGRFRGIPFQRLAAVVSTSGRTVHLSDAVAELPGATVLASGDVGIDGRLDLQIRAANVALARLAPAAGLTGIRGTGAFTGTVTGNVSAPRVQGVAQVLAARVGGVPIDVARGPITWTPTRLTIDASLARYPAVATLRGSATRRADGQTALDMRARLRSGRLESILADLRMKPLGHGSVTTADEVVIRGTMAAPDVRGRVVVADASVQGYPVDTAAADFHFTRQAVVLTDLEAVSSSSGGQAPARLLVPSVRLAGGRLKTVGPVSLTNVDLERFTRLGAPYVRLTGIVNVTAGSVSGAPGRPLASASVQVQGFSINTVPFQDVGFNAYYNADGVTVSDLRLARGGANVIDVPRARWNMQTRQASASVRVAALSVNDIREMMLHSEWLGTAEASSARAALARFPQQPVDATLTIGDAAGGAAGTLEVSGSLHNLSAVGAATVVGLRLENHRIDRASLAATVQNLRFQGRRLVAGEIVVPPGGLHAESEKMLVDGDFTGRVGGGVTAMLDAKNVPLSFAQPFLPPKLRQTPLDGSLTLTANASGPLKSPTITASVSSRDITVGERKFPFTVRTGTVLVSNTDKGPVITTNSIRLTARDHAVSIHGTIPFDWQTLRIRPNDELNLAADLNEQGLDIIQLAFSDPQSGPVQSTGGTVEGNVTVHGTLNKPNWEGFVRVRDGELKLRALTGSLRNIQADLRFDADRTALVVDRLTMASASGGSLAAEPGGTLRLVSNAEATTIVPDLAVKLDNLRLEETPNYFRYGERVRGNLATASSPVRIEAGPAGPKISGQLLVSNADLTPPNTTPPAIPNAKPPSIVPSFDLTFAVGKNVWVRNSLLRVRFEDRVPQRDRYVRLWGDLVQPRLDGRLTSRDGAFTFPTARFQLTDALVEVHYPVAPEIAAVNVMSEGISPVSITANAQARLTAVVNGRRQPVTVYMHVEGGGATAQYGPAFETLAPYRFTLRSSPSLPERQLTGLITREAALQALAQGGATQDVLRQEAMNILQASVLPEALSGIENRLGAAFGLESLNLDYLNEEHAVSVTATKRIGKRLLLSYSRPVGATAGATDAYTVGLSLQISTRLRLTLQQQKGPTLIGGQVVPLPAGQSNIVDTSILLEGTKSF